MKFITFLILFFQLSFALCLCSCGNEKSATAYRLSALPVEDNERDSYGLLGADGKILSADFEYAPGPVVNGYFSVHDSSATVALCRVDESGYHVVSSASGYSEFGIMNDDRIPACRGEERIAILDGEGNCLFSLTEFDGREVRSCASYSCGKLKVVLQDGAVGYVDKAGNKLFEQTFLWGTDFVNDKALVEYSENEYALIDGNGKKLFSFFGVDEEYVKISHEYSYICSKNDEDLVTVYDFSGQKVCECPEKVEEIHSFGKDGFIFKKDYENGLMDYTGSELIRARYEQLVFNGNSLLAIDEDRDDEILLLDFTGKTIGTLDGEEIYSPQEYGFEFFNLIKREDEEIYLIDHDGRRVGEPIDVSVDLDDLPSARIVNSLYFPKEEVLREVMGLCGNGVGFDHSLGVFYYEDGRFCKPSDVKLIKAAPTDELVGETAFSKTISSGLNYSLDIEFLFSGSIVNSGSGVLNPSAMLSGMKITVATSDIFTNAAFFNLCRRTLVDEYGCEVISQNNSDYLLAGNDEDENLIILIHEDPQSHLNWTSAESHFYIFLRQRNKTTVAYWTDIIQKGS